MSTSNASTKTIPSTSSPKSKSKATKKIVLKVSPLRLVTFPHEEPERKPSIAKAAQPPQPAPSSSASSPKPSAADSDATPASKQEPSTESNPGTPGESSSLKVPTDAKKKGPGVKAGVKRPASALSVNPLKERAKPGPKKKLKLDGGPDETSRPWTTPAPAAGHKLGPKANQGAINAGLRALDRTGTPCRKWSKAGFSVKSFTGVTWDCPSWATQARSEKGKSSTPENGCVDETVGGEGMERGISNVGSEASKMNGNVNGEEKLAVGSPMVATSA